MGIDGCSRPMCYETKQIFDISIAMRAPNDPFGLFSVIQRCSSKGQQGKITFFLVTTSLGTYYYVEKVNQSHIPCGCASRTVNILSYVLILQQNELEMDSDI